MSNSVKGGSQSSACTSRGRAVKQALIGLATVLILLVVIIAVFGVHRTGQSNGRPLQAPVKVGNQVPPEYVHPDN